MCKKENGLNIRIYPFAFFFLISWCYLPDLPAQVADTLYQRAQTAFQNQQFDQAYQFFENAGQHYLENENDHHYLKCRVEMARCSQFTSLVSRQAMGDIINPAINLISNKNELEKYLVAAECYQFLARYQWAINGQYDESINSYEKALEICAQMGDSARQYRMATFSDLSHVYSNQEEFDRALRYARLALEISREIYGEDHVENGARYYSLGFTYYRKGFFDDAIREIKKGIRLLEEHNGPEMQIGLGYNNLAAVYVAKLDKDGAKQSSLAAQEILSRYLGPEHEAIGTILWDLGSMYVDLEEFDLAEENLKRAIEIFRNKFGDAYPQFPQLFHQLAFCYDQTGNFARAEEWHLQAYQLNRQTFGDEHPRTGDSFRQLTNHYLEQKDLSQAEAVLERGLTIVNKPGNQSTILRAGLFEAQAKYLELKGELKKSIQAYDEAIRAICFEEDGQTCSVDQTFNPLYFTQFNSDKTRILFREYLIGNDKALLHAALISARQAHAGIRALRNSYQDAESKLFLQKRARQHYNLMLEILFSIWINKRDQDILTEAWQISEQAKSLLLLEEIKSTRISLAGVPDDLLDSIRHLRQVLNFQKQRINESSASNDSTGQVAFIKTRSKLSTLEDSMEKDHPAYHALRMEMTPVALADVVAILPPSTTLIEYYLGDTSLFVFKIDKQVTWHKIKLTENFSTEVGAYREAMQQLEDILENPRGALEAFQRRSKYLYSQLLSDSRDSSFLQGNHVMIVPDQELGYISFESLVDPLTNRYLIEDYTVSYAYSASLYALEMQGIHDRSLQDFAGFAPEYPRDSNRYNQDLALNILYRDGRFDLPGAQEEVTQISELLAGDMWAGNEATESIFKEKAPDYSLIHLSLHGLIDEADPMQSRLLFYRENDGQDGDLHAYEIYHMHLAANLLVLSACNTGAGALQTGEGILSLARAFAFAGVPNMIASLWRADDAATSRIMIGFYEGLSKGLLKADALRQAKLDYLAAQRSDVYKHPYFWSSFILVGENVSKFKDRDTLYWWIGMILIFTTAFAIFRKKQKSENNPV